VRRIGQSGRVLGLFEELADRDVVAGVEIDDPELIGEPDGLADAGDRRLGARLDVRVSICSKSMRYTWSAPITTTMSGFSSWMRFSDCRMASAEPENQRLPRRCCAGTDAT
jgi:hypothetical protein